MMLDSLGTRALLETESGKVGYFRLQTLAEQGLADVARLPFSIKILLEAVLRAENGREVTRDDVLRLAAYDPAHPPKIDVPFLPARVLLQDFTGVPCVVDLAAMRTAMARLGGDPQRVNPLIPVDLVIDHSVQVDVFGSADALARNAELEFARNSERYAFLRWGQGAFDNFSVVPPASGICHQVNLEYLASVVERRTLDGEDLLFPDTLVGTDSHTPMVNGLGVLGWGVGGIEAEAVMLGQPLYFVAPAVVGVKLSGRLREGVTATDLVLTITQLLRRHGVVEKFVEFYGPGLSTMTVPDRATISNMAPEYGATCGYFPVDEQTLVYLRATGRPREVVERTERYCKEQGLFRTDATADPTFAQTLELDLGSVEPSLAGPKRPQDRVPLNTLKTTWDRLLGAPVQERGFGLSDAERKTRVATDLPGGGRELTHGDVAIAAITSCTNTSNPSVMMAAGLLAKKAVEAGLHRRPWVKSSLAPGSLVVTEYLDRTGLSPYLDELGFQTVGYGCTTCIGNSGPLPEPVDKAVEKGQLVVAAVLSGNRNFEGRINPSVRASFLTSPPLVVAFALAGTVNIDLEHEPLGTSAAGRPVYLRDIWPSGGEVAAAVEQALDPEVFRAKYQGIGQSNPAWNEIPVAQDALYPWSNQSTYIHEPPFFQTLTAEVRPVTPIVGARTLVMVGDSVTTDHISPAGSIAPSGPAGRYLQTRGVKPADFNSYGSRRGNDEVMARGTFANVRLRNLLAPGTEGGVTTFLPTGEVLPIFDAAERYRAAGTPLVVLAGQDYGMGSSRDWAAKGALMLGVQAVIARSFERIHRSNLVGMGILPLQLAEGQTFATLGLTGRETFSIQVDDELRPNQNVRVEAVDEHQRRIEFTARCRIDSQVEVGYYRNGGILQTVLRRFLSEG